MGESRLKPEGWGAQVIQSTGVSLLALSADPEKWRRSGEGQTE